jgi:hypothetical protein
MLVAKSLNSCFSLNLSEPNFCLDRTLMNYAALDFKSLSLNEQKGLILLFCNMFATESRRWLMYFSEWETDAGDVTSNAKVSGSGPMCHKHAHK